MRERVQRAVRQLGKRRNIGDHVARGLSQQAKDRTEVLDGAERDIDRDIALLLDQQVLKVDLDPLQQCAKLAQDRLVVDGGAQEARKRAVSRRVALGVVAGELDLGGRGLDPLGTGLVAVQMVAVGELDEVEEAVGPVGDLLVDQVSTRVRSRSRTWSLPPETSRECEARVDGDKELGERLGADVVGPPAAAAMGSLTRALWTAAMALASNVSA